MAADLVDARPIADPPDRWNGIVTVPFDPVRRATVLPVAAALAHQAGMAVEAVAAPAPGVPSTAAYLAARRRDLAAAGVPTVPPRELAGDPAVAIVDHAAAGATSLLCMATRGRGVLSEQVLGSVTARILRHSPVPVMLVGPALLNPGTPTRRILVGLDGSPLARHALDAAVSLGGRLGVGVELVHVLDPGAPEPEPPEDAVLQAVAATMTPPPVRLDVVHDSSPAWALVELAGSAGDAVVVVGTHGRTGVDRLVLGSVSHALARHAHCPVLVVPRTAAASLDGDRPG